MVITTTSEINPLPHAALLAAYQDALLTTFPEQIELIILFGSQARGEAQPESDVDVLVVVSWEEQRQAGQLLRYSDSRWREVIYLACDLSLLHEAWLSPKVMSEQQFAAWTPLGDIIKEEGIVLWDKSRKLSKLS